MFQVIQTVFNTNSFNLKMIFFSIFDYYQEKLDPNHKIHDTSNLCLFEICIFCKKVCLKKCGFKF